MLTVSARNRAALEVGILIALSLFACRATAQSAEPPQFNENTSASARAFYAQTFSKTPSLPAMLDIGRSLFFDPALSVSGKTSCASCHDPRYAYGPKGFAAVELAGPNLKTAGLRAVPSLRYLQSVPRFSEHYFDESAPEGSDQGPTGGRTWDGRASSAHEQAMLPLLSPFEMANRSPPQIVSKVERAPYADEIRAAFGPEVFASSDRALKAILMSLEVFQQSPADFYPYDSRYDAWLRGVGTLTAQESRGLALFNDPRKGNCAQCHPSQVRGGALPPFTDFGFIALGVPRNPRIPANHDTRFYDLGLCGPERHDLAGHSEYCGLFRTPTLRNVALRHVFFHNGVFHSLREVLQFYVERDRSPQRWYGREDSSGVRQYEDLPRQYSANIYHGRPLDRQGADPPALSDADINDVIAFLQTLTDVDLLNCRSSSTAGSRCTSFSAVRRPPVGRPR